MRLLERQVVLLEGVVDVGGRKKLRQILEDGLYERDEQAGALIAYAPSKCGRKATARPLHSALTSSLLASHKGTFAGPAQPQHGHYSPRQSSQHPKLSSMPEKSHRRMISRRASTTKWANTVTVVAIVAAAD